MRSRGCVNFKFLPHYVYTTDPPEILIHPNLTTEVDAYNTVIFTCVASGDPAPSIIWRKGNTELTNASQLLINETLVISNGVTFLQSSLVLCSVEEADAGDYSCVSENIFGNDTAASVLTVNARGT